MTLPNYGAVIRKKFTRSGQPDEAGFAKLFKKGVTVLVKLNENWEYSDADTKKYFKGQVLLEPLSQFSSAGQMQIAEGIADVIDKLLKKGNWVHVHCHRGIDRAGLVVGMWKLRHGGFTLKQVQNDWKKYGSPFPAYERMLIQEAAELGK